MGDSPNPTNADLMNAIIAVSNKQTEDHVLLTTMRDSHYRRIAMVQRFENDTRIKLTTIEQRQSDIRRRVQRMEPVVDRIARRDLVRRALAHCVARWWKFTTAAAAAVAGVIAWANDWLPKLMKLIK